MLLVLRKIDPCRRFSPGYQAVQLSCDRLELCRVEFTQCPADILLRHVKRHQKYYVPAIQILYMYVSFEGHTHKLLIYQVDGKIQQLSCLLAKYALRQECVSFSRKVAECESYTASYPVFIIGCHAHLLGDLIGLFEPDAEHIFYQPVRILFNSLDRVFSVYLIKLHSIVSTDSELLQVKSHIGELPVFCKGLSYLICCLFSYAGHFRQPVRIFFYYAKCVLTKLGDYGCRSLPPYPLHHT